MTRINTYLNFDGDCEAAFNFYRDVIGGEFEHTARFSEMPADPENPVPEADMNKIMHVTLAIGEHWRLMGSDTCEAFGLPPLNAGNNFLLSLEPDSREEADRLFNGLSASGQVTMEMGDTFWGAYFGSFVDKFGISWMVNFTLEQEPQ